MLSYLNEVCSLCFNINEVIIDSNNTLASNDKKTFLESMLTKYCHAFRRICFLIIDRELITRSGRFRAQPLTIYIKINIDVNA